MKILLTGGAGFIGSHLAAALINREHSVVIVDNLSTGRREYIPEKATFYERDIRDENLMAIFEQEKPDAVSHHAAQMSVLISMRDPMMDASNNILGSLNVLACAQAAGIKHFLFASSGGTVYGEPENLPVNEDSPKHPLSPYAINKLSMEHYLYMYQKATGLQYTVLRYANVYGPRQSPHGEAGVIAIFAERMLKGESTLIHGDGTQERDFIYISDIVAANLAVLENTITGTFNIGTGTGININQIYDLLNSATGYNRSPVHGPAKAGEVYKIILDCNRAQKTLGWQAKTPLQEGISRTVNFFKGGKAIPL